MKPCLLFIFISLPFIASGQYSIISDYNLSNDLSEQTIEFPSEINLRNKEYAHGFSVSVQRQLNKHFSMGLGYRFKENWITTREGNFLKSSNLINHVHSVPINIVFTTTPFNYKRLGRMKLHCTASIFYNRLREQSFIAEEFSFGVPPFYISNSDFNSNFVKNTISVEGSFFLSYPLYKSLGLRLGVSRHFGFKDLVEKTYTITEFTGYAERGNSMSNGSYSTLSLGLSYKLKGKKN